MRPSFIGTTLIAATLLLSADLSLAAETKSGTSGAASSVSKTIEKNAKPKQTKAVKLVDINRASKRVLKTLPGIGDAEADRIIAGRPYLSKAHLTTRNIVSLSVYEELKTKVIARQK